jgi:DNA/RNA-binding domain of Phe-tRNA-synthetase-like protein
MIEGEQTMDFYVEQAVLDAGVKILFAAAYGIDNHGEDPEWAAYREKRLEELYTAYETLEVHDDPILEGFNILHDRTGVKRRKNIPASENLIKLLKKNRGMFYINQAVDIYNLISLESKLALGAHNIDRADGNITLRFTDGSERFVPIGQSEPIPVAAHEYSYCDDANEVLCRLEIRQVEKTKVDEEAQNVFYIVQGNDATPDELLRETAQRIIDLTTRYCGGRGEIIVPSVI